MGRQFRAARVAKTVQKNLSVPIARHPSGGQRFARPPPWLAVMEMIPPSEILTRPAPVVHEIPDPRMMKPRRTFIPEQITYEEDELRQNFFRDHPWELARPRVIVEFDGKDRSRYDWSRGLRQPGLPLCGECVVQRQLWMMHNVPGMTKEQAYDKARKEFYRLRQYEEIESRIAQEEARMVGAYFGKTRLQVAMQIEDKEFERWKSWAGDQIAKIDVERSQAYSSFGDNDAKDGNNLDSNSSAPEEVP